MILLGKVSSISGGYKITFPDKENVVSPPLPKAAHVDELLVNSSVIVAFTAEDIATGIIIGKL